MAHFEKRLSSETKFEGRVITVTLDRVELENGGTSTREVVRHHGGAGVAALNDEGEIYLVRQYRYALDRELIEIPAGKLEKGEDPLEAAKRELGEEAGLAAAEYRDLGYIIPTCGYCSETIYLYAAKGLSPVGQHLDADEFLSVFTLPLDKAAEMVLSGEITDSKTVAAVLKVKAPRDAPEKRPSVMSATDLSSFMPASALVGLSISRIPGPPTGPSYRMTTTSPGWMRPL